MGGHLSSLNSLSQETQETQEKQEKQENNLITTDLIIESVINTDINTDVNSKIIFEQNESNNKVIIDLFEVASFDDVIMKNKKRNKKRNKIIDKN
jgi:hypothetical protein